jgi:hypothetical protein
MPIELEYLEGLVKLGRRKKDETRQTWVQIVGKPSKLHKEVICLNHMEKGEAFTSMLRLMNIKYMV